MPAFPMRRAFLTNTPADRNISTTPTNPTMTDRENVKTIKSREAMKTNSRPDAVPAGVAVHGLRTHTFGEFRILLVQGLLELVENALFVLRERQLPRPPIPVSTPLSCLIS